jgi:hypothetical protein
VFLNSEFRKIEWIDEWVPVTLYAQVSSAVDYRLTIYDQDLAEAPSVIEIRHLMLFEKDRE